MCGSWLVLQLWQAGAFAYGQWSVEPDARLADYLSTVQLDAGLASVLVCGGVCLVQQQGPVEGEQQQAGRLCCRCG
jgi:hypothetical protein